MLSLQKIRSAEILNDPYPHIIVDDVLDDFDSLMEELPKCEFSYFENLTCFPVINTETLVRSSSKLFSDLVDHFCNKEVENCFKEKFGVTQPSYSAAALQRHTKNYRIPPHRDVGCKIITWMIYFKTEGVGEGAGTNLCVIKEGCENLLNPNEEHKKWKWFDVVKRVPCKSNTMFAFAPSEISWHSVNMRKIHEGRTTLRGFVFDKYNPRRGGISIGSKSN